MRPKPDERPETLLTTGQTAAVQATLDRMLASPAFRNSKQCQKFLEHVVLHSHRGEDERLKERTIGADVFGRAPDYDTADDPVVRVRATEVRKRLAQYYQESAQPEDVRFEIPSGSYRADFRWPSEAKRVEPSLHAVAARPRRLWIPALAGAVVLAVAGVAVWRPKAPASTVDRFWEPVLSSPKPVLIYCGQPVVYFLSREVRARYRATVPAERQHEPVALAPDEIVHGRDIIPVTDQFVGIGNAHTAATLSSLFAVRSKPVEIRYANDLSFSDLRGYPSVLIGAFSNLWTLEMTKGLRFVFEQESGPRRIRDRSNNKTYQLADLAPDGKTPEDYAVVSRLFDAATGQPLVSAAGITQYGTRAAGELMIDDARLSQTLQRLQGWERKNVQILLRTTVYKGTPAAPQVIDAYAW